MFSSNNACDFLIVGLGNPGKQYAQSRHNVGWRCLDALAEKLDVKPNRVRFRGSGCSASYHGKKLYLLKPETMMNLSGLSVAQAARFYKLKPEQIIIIFDDISLDVGRLRLRDSGSAGGHNGIKSIIAELQSDAFPRVKVGVGAKPHPDYDLVAWVLSDFSAADAKKMDEAFSRAADAVCDYVENGYAHAANIYNAK